MVQETMTVKQAAAFLKKGEWGDTPRVLIKLANGVVLSVPAGTTAAQVSEAVAAAGELMQEDDPKADK